MIFEINLGDYKIIGDYKREIKLRFCDELVKVVVVM